MPHTPRDDHRHEVEARDEEDAEEGRKAHAAHDSDAHAAASRCTGTGRKGEREATDDGGEGRHEDRAEAELRRFEDGIYRIHPMIHTFFDKFHDEDGILRRETDDHDDAGLHVDAVLVTVARRAEEGGELVHYVLREDSAEDARRHREEDGERHRPALVERGQTEERKDERQS